VADADAAEPRPGRAAAVLSAGVGTNVSLVAAAMAVTFIAFVCGFCKWVVCGACLDWDEPADLTVTLGLVNPILADLFSKRSEGMATLEERTEDDSGGECIAKLGSSFFSDDPSETPGHRICEDAPSKTCLPGQLRLSPLGCEV
jgi:hypothetical protein